MDLRSLRAFVEVVRRGGFSSAANVLNSTQPTVSKAVKQLEDELSIPLLNRAGKGAKLTEAGGIVYSHAVAMLGERDNLRAEIAELKGLKRGTLRIGLPPVGSSVLFAPLVAKYRARHPEIDIVLQEYGSKKLEELVRTEEIELGASLLPFGQAFDWQVLCSEPMVALIPPDHPVWGQDQIKLTDLATSNFILFERGFGINSVIETACRKRDFMPREVVRSSQTDFIIALVASGMGVAILPRLVVEQRMFQTVHLALIDEPDLRWNLAMFWRRGSYLSPPARAWLQLTKEYSDQHK